MAKQDIQTIIGSSISKDEILLKNFKSIKSCFVGWVESYNETSGTVNVQPAIQDYIPNDEQNGNNYRNSPLLANVWVLGTFKSTAVEKGDKAVCFVLDQKSNDFFKSIYDSSISLGFQTYKPKTSAQKSVCDCVCVILGDASFQEVYEAISAIDTALENKADIDGTYPDMTVGNATNVTDNINGTPITNIFESDGLTVKKATQAIEDGEGNVITATYAKTSDVGTDLLWSGKLYGTQTVELETYSNYKYLTFFINGNTCLYTITMDTSTTSASGIGFPKDEGSLHCAFLLRSGNIFSIGDIGFVSLGATAFTSRKTSFAPSYYIYKIYGIK